MVKAAGTEEAIERFKLLVNPERYRQGAQQTKDELIQRGEQLLLQYDLNENDPNLNDRDRALMDRQLKDAINSVLWRIAECDEILGSFKAGAEAGLNRAARRRLFKGHKGQDKPKLQIVDDVVDDDYELEEKEELED